MYGFGEVASTMLFCILIPLPWQRGLRDPLACYYKLCRLLQLACVHIAALNSSRSDLCPAETAPPHVLRSTTEKPNITLA